jgi:metallo-beta-lactamase family protein
MKIHFHGATGDVTGSAYHVKTKRASVLLDCGLFQGGKESRAKNRYRAKLEYEVKYAQQRQTSDSNRKPSL